ncbi:endolytic transglycosylase MltG [Candidatus Shapirobacteria bacterium]|nr:endolytic transglycosylase MltG [Candidatus Shapirobacteria bacterium]
MKKLVVSILFAFVLVLVSAYIYISNGLKPVSTTAETKQFVINPGDSTSIIAARLQKNQLVRNKNVFMLMAYYLKLNNQLQSGLFKLSPSMSAEEVAKTLSSGGSHDYWLKIIDGQRIAEIVPTFDPTLEGYIFPDSYLIPQDYSDDQILSIISSNFQKKYQQAAQGSSVTLSEKEAVILASLIEREARTLVSKQMVSGILHNRLEANMALQIDATAQYIRDSRQKPEKYWLPATKNDLDAVSPYNTYLHPGLPPGPICNPGYDSLYAALHPTASDYVYYITGNDNKMHYAKTLDEHNQNIDLYLK